MNSDFHVRLSDEDKISFGFAAVFAGLSMADMVRKAVDKYWRDLWTAKMLELCDFADKVLAIVEPEQRRAFELAELSTLEPMAVKAVCDLEEDLRGAFILGDFTEWAQASPRA